MNRPHLAPGFRILVIACVILASIAAMSASPVLGYPRPGRTERASADPAGTGGNGDSYYYTATNPDGRYVAFYSHASNLVPGDTNGYGDVFLRDRRTGAIERVSVASDGTEGDSSSHAPALSADGRFVAFSSFAGNLLPGGTSVASPDIFVRDRETGITERVSVSSAGIKGNQASFAPSISADGRYVVFESVATNLVPGDTNNAWDIFLHDRQTRTTTRVSVTSDGAQAAVNYGSAAASISADGRYVTFSSSAANLAPGDVNRADDIFVHDHTTGTTERVSVASDGAQANQSSFDPSISGDGRYVAFESWGFNLVPADLNRAPDIFVHDRVTGTTERVSVSSAGGEGTPLGHSYRATIAADGRHVAFESAAANLVSGDTNSAWDVFVHDRAAGTTERVSVTSAGTQGDGDARYASLSGNGRMIVFQSAATNLVDDDVNGVIDVFVRDNGPDVGVGDLEVSGSGSAVNVSGWASLSGAPVSASGDPVGDAPGSVGGDIVAASITYRPEPEDLLLRMRLDSMPGMFVAAPPMLYRWTLTAGTTAYEVRAVRMAASTDPSAEPHIALYRCTPACVEVTRLAGSIGTTGPDVTVALPLGALGAQEGIMLSGISALADVGEPRAGSLGKLDTVELATGSIPGSSLELAIAPVSTAEEDLVNMTAAELRNGRFEKSLDASGLPSGDHNVWARACLGTTCGAHAVTFRR